MVDVQASNKKLEKRSEEMLRHLTGRSGEEARAALINAEGSVKLAVLLLHGCRPEEAKMLLDRNNGRLRTALAELRASRQAPE